MTVLTQFTPAETLVLTNGSSATLRQLLKVTFLDLIMKQVLKTKSPTYELDAEGTNTAEKYVVPGGRFFGYPAKPHEQFLLQPFYDYPNTSLLFKYVVELSYKGTRSKGRFFAAICGSPAMEGLVTRSFFNKLFGTITITPAGREKAAELKKALQNAEERLPVLSRTNRSAALAMTALLGGAVLLLQADTLAGLDGLDRELLAGLEPHQPKPYDGGSGCGSWNSVSDYSGSWDSGCGSSDGNSSGCGGDSGCSSGGDSGCSGCGGCGGGD